MSIFREQDTNDKMNGPVKGKNEKGKKWLSFKSFLTPLSTCMLNLVVFVMFMGPHWLRIVRDNRVSWNMAVSLIINNQNII